MIKLFKLIIASIVVLTFFACPDPVGTVSDAEQAEALTLEAAAALQNQDFNTALSNYSEALILDPSNEKAVIGYTALNIMDLITDPNVVSMMRSNLGFVNYPSAINEVIDSTVWMTEKTIESEDEPGEYYTYIFPTLDLTETAWSGSPFEYDGNPDFYHPIEWQYALMQYIATNNTGFNFVSETIETALGSRFDNLIDMLNDYVTDDMTFTISYTVMFQTEADALNGGWPSFYNSLLDDYVLLPNITIGKAELQLLVSQLQVVRSLAYFVSMYELDFSVSDYWTAFVAGSFDSSIEQPFTSLLGHTADAAAKLASSKASMLAAFNSSKAGIQGILSDRDGMTVSSSNTIMFNLDNITFSDAIGAASLNTVIQMIDVSITSLNDSTTAYYPADPALVEAGSIYPTSMTDAAFGMNLGQLFSTPLPLIGAGGVYETDTDGDPLFYTLSGGTFSVVTAAPDPSIQPEEKYYLRGDLSVGGIVSVDPPMDDPATQYKIEEYSTPPKLSWTDSDSDGFWDVGETIIDADFYINSAIEGFIILATEAADYTGTASDFYNGSLQHDGLFAALPADLLESYAYASNAYSIMYDNEGTPITDPVDFLDSTLVNSTATPAQLAAAIDLADVGDIDHQYKYDTFIYYTGTYMYATNDSPLPSTALFVWASLAPDTTTVTFDYDVVEPGDETFTSVGSYWWFLVNQMFPIM